MEASDYAADEVRQETGYPRCRFALFLTLLVVILAFISGLQRVGLRPAEGPAISEAALQGDVAAKAAYAYRHAKLLGAARDAEADQFQELALSQYERAVDQSANPGHGRRLIILQYEIGRPGLAERIDAFEKRSASGARRARVVREAEMWRHIYLGEELTQDDVQAYERRVRELDLGWYERVTLNHLYRRAGQADRAREHGKGAARAATTTILSLAGIVATILVLGTVGLGLLVAYVTGKRQPVTGARPGPVTEEPAARSRKAGCLLETFVVYLGCIVGVQLLGAMVVGSYRLTSRGEVSAAVGVYLLAGLLALTYLAARLASAGWSWSMVGLRSTQPWTDVAWGIGGYAVAVPLIIATTALSQVLSRYISTPENPIVPLFAQSETLFEQMILLVLAVVIAPFFEELFFRGVLHTSFSAKWGVVAGVVGSALAFAAVHPFPLGFLPIFALGMVFAVLLHERGSLLPPMIAHGMNNAVAFAFLFILTG